MVWRFSAADRLISSPWAAWRAPRVWMDPTVWPEPRRSHRNGRASATEGRWMTGMLLLTQRADSVAGTTPTTRPRHWADTSMASPRWRANPDRCRRRIATGALAGGAGGAAADNSARAAACA